MLKDLVLKNRSYRGFNPNRPVTFEELTDMVDCARLTASTVNIQPMKYYLAWQKEQTDKILPCIKFAKALANIQLPHPGTKPTAYIVILLDKSISDNVARYQRDYGIAAQTILLRAAEMGLARLHDRLRSRRRTEGSPQSSRASCPHAGRCTGRTCRRCPHRGDFRG